MEEFKIQNGVLLSYTGNASAVSVPEGVIKIGTGCFKGNIGVTEVFLPDSVKEIGREAFYDTFHLADIRLPSGLESIDSEAFRFSGLKKIYLPETLRYIGPRALTNITVYSKEQVVIQHYCYHNEDDYDVEWKFYSEEWIREGEQLKKDLQRATEDRNAVGKMKMDFEKKNKTTLTLNDPAHSAFDTLFMILSGVLGLVLAVLCVSPLESLISLIFGSEQNLGGFGVLIAVGILWLIFFFALYALSMELCHLRVKIPHSKAAEAQTQKEFYFKRWAELNDEVKHLEFRIKQREEEEWQIERRFIYFTGEPEPSQSRDEPTISPKDDGADWNGMPHQVDYNNVKDM